MEGVMRISFLASGLVVALGMTACGGGGSGPQDTTIPDGLYAGATSTDRAFTGLVLDDGTYYVLYSAQNSPNVIAGVVQGTGSAADGTFSSTNARDFNLEGMGVLSAQLSASYVVKQSLTGSITYPSLNQTNTFAGTYDSDYELTPSLAAIAGTYSGDAASPGGSENTTLTVSTTGAISGTGASGCTFTGAAAPRARGNAYNASITFGGAPCLYPGVTVSGGAYFDAGTKSLYAVALTSARDNAVIFLGAKP
jgi:hypothetical protein